MKIGLLWNALSYVFVNLFLTFVWRMTGRRYFWPAWPMAVWGLGLSFHGAAVCIALCRRASRSGREM